MSVYVAFLRGMNIGGRRITNEDLCSACERIGLEGVETFRASGNVVFDAPECEDRSAGLAARLESGLIKELGYEVPVFLRSGEEVAAIAAREPFPPKQVAASKGKLQVALLPDSPGKLARKEALALGSDEDRLAIEGSELYWLPSGGTAESKLDQRTLEAELGPWTMRTMGTIEQIAAKHCG